MPRLRLLDVSTNRARGSLMHLSTTLQHGACPSLRVLVVKGATPTEDKVERLFAKVKNLSIQ